MKQQFSVIFLLLNIISASQAAWVLELTYVEKPANRSDSFFASDGQGLYLVEQMELHPFPVRAAEYSEKWRERVEGYFVVSGEHVVHSLGSEALGLVRQVTAAGFRVEVVRGTPLGDGQVTRLRGYVLVGEEVSLAGLLVEAGLAVPRGAYGNHFRDRELLAALGRRGAWRFTDQDRFISQRLVEPESAAEVARASAKGQISINTASAKELEGLPGIGPALAQRIIEARPFASVEELTRVRGIGPKTLAKLRDQAGL